MKDLRIVHRRDAKNAEKILEARFKANIEF